MSSTLIAFVQRNYGIFHSIASVEWLTLTDIHVVRRLLVRRQVVELSLVVSLEPGLGLVAVVRAVHQVREGPVTAPHWRAVTAALEPGRDWNVGITTVSQLRVEELEITWDGGLYSSKLLTVR